MADRTDDGREGGYWGADDTDRSWIDARAEAHQGPFGGRGPEGWRRSDDRLRELICERLRDDHLLDARHIEVRVEDGVIELNGQVHAGADIQLAQMLARGTPGAGDIRNNLTQGDANASGSSPLDRREKPYEGPFLTARDRPMST